MHGIRESRGSWRTAVPLQNSFGSVRGRRVGIAINKRVVEAHEVVGVSDKTRARGMITGVQADLGNGQNLYLRSGAAPVHPVRRVAVAPGIAGTNDAQIGRDNSRLG